MPDFCVPVKYRSKNYMSEALAHRNECHIHGVLAKDPQIRYTPTGKQVATLTMITRYKERSEFHRVVLWEELAQKVEALHKGDFLRVVGRLQTRTWEDGAKVKHYSTEIIAFQLVIPEKEKQETTTTAQGKATAQAILRPAENIRSFLP
jgi:single-strand DNA-binding protein